MHVTVTKKQRVRLRVRRGGNNVDLEARTAAQRPSDGASQDPGLKPVGAIKHPSPTLRTPTIHFAFESYSCLQGAQCCEDSDSIHHNDFNELSPRT